MRLLDLMCGEQWAIAVLYSCLVESPKNVCGNRQLARVGGDCWRKKVRRWGY